MSQILAEFVSWRQTFREGCPCFGPQVSARRTLWQPLVMMGAWGSRAAAGWGTDALIDRLARQAVDVPDVRSDRPVITFDVEN